MKTVSVESRHLLRHFFADYSAFHAAIDAILRGAIGTAVVDDLDSPSLAILSLPQADFFIGGQPSIEAAQRVLAFLPLDAYFLVPPSWAGFAPSWFGQAAIPRDRTNFGMHERASGIIPPPVLAPEYEVRRVERETVGAFRDLSWALVASFASLEDFLENGVGFGVWHAGRFVSGCSSYAIGEGKIEFEVQTDPAFRRQGFAWAALCALIDYCYARGLQPSWDAANQPSAHLAERLGFGHPNRIPPTWYKRNREQLCRRREGSNAIIGGILSGLSGRPTVLRRRCLRGRSLSAA